jgi:hypothetical protein
MTTAKGCKPIPIIIKGELVEPLKFGERDGDYEYGQSLKTTRCHDCGAKIGGYHHVGCDADYCPRCGQQLIFGCTCMDKNPKVTIEQYNEWLEKIGYIKKK